MKTARSRRSRPMRMGNGIVALAMGVLALTGCATAGGQAAAPPPAAAAPQYPPTGAYKFTIAFVNGCPASARVDYANCDPSLPPNDASQKKDCARARNGHKVTFAASPGAQFLLRFDPFDQSATTQPPPEGWAITALPPKGTSKTFTFGVLSAPPAKCPPLDPQIIVDN